MQLSDEICAEDVVARTLAALLAKECRDEVCGNIKQCHIRRGGVQRFNSSSLLELHKSTQIYRINNHIRMGNSNVTKEIVFSFSPLIVPVGHSLSSRCSRRALSDRAVL